MKFKVLRQHQGDRMYFPGDMREIAEAEVKHLIANGVIEKMEPAPENKAEDGAPQNKSRKRKAGDA